MLPKSRNRKKLVAYITAGDPSLAVTERLVYQLEKAGADIIELGIPFSDPLADGPVIQASHQRALKTSLAEVFRLVKKVRRRTAIPVYFMLSYNLVLQYGEEKFHSDCAKFGVSGAIIPDLPPEERSKEKKVRREERGERREEKLKNCVARVFLIAPTSTEPRLKLAAEQATGFIYLVSTTGVTGKREAFSADLAPLVAKIRRYSRLPIMIGFGISNPQQAAAAAKIADGVIVGSALVDLIAQKRYPRLLKLVAQMRRALDAR